MRRIGWLVLTALIMSACVPSKIVWTESYNFPSGEWAPDNRISFSPDSDLLKTDNPILLTMLYRYAADASAEAFKVAVEMEWPEYGVYTVDTMKVEMLPGAKRDATSGRLGVFETSDTLRLKHGVRPGWNITLHPLIEEPVKGLFSITLDLENEK